MSGICNMVKSCCAVGCANRSRKGCGLSFYWFPADKERRPSWVAALNRKNWQPTEHSWHCLSHFIGGKKSDDPLSPDYIPSVFSYVKGPVKRKRKHDLEAYTRRKRAKIVRLEAARQEEAIREAAASLIELGSMITEEVHEHESENDKATDSVSVDATTQMALTVLSKDKIEEENGCLKADII